MHKINVKQELAINELLKGNSIIESAKNIGISEATLNRWLANPVFKDVLNGRKKQIVDKCIDSINLMGDKALKVINSILDNENASDYVRLNASKSILDMIIKFKEQNEIIEKMEEIEELLNKKVGFDNE